MKHSDNIKQNHTLSKLTEKLQDLPMLPAVVAQLMTLSASDESFFEDVLKLASDDPPFSVRILHLANSASHAPASPITTLPQAIARIGAQCVVNLIFSMAVIRVFMPSTQGQRNLWVHAIQVAITSREIAKLAPSLKVVAPEQAYLCGLMHDIGRFVLFDESAEELGKIDETNWTTPKQLVEIEMKLCGFNHAELGWHACQQWGLPKIIQLCVKKHHDYSLHASIPEHEKIIDLVHIIQVADFFSLLIMLEPEILSLPEKELEQKISERCFPSENTADSPCSARQLQRIATNIYQESEDILSSLGLKAN